MTTQPVSEPNRPSPDSTKFFDLASTGIAPVFTADQLSAGQRPSVASPGRRPQRPPRPEQPTRPGDGVPSNLLLDKFRDRLPIPAVIRAHRQPSERPLRIRAGIVRDRVHADLPEADFWGYEGSVPGPTIETRRGRPVLVDWVNDLHRGGRAAALPYDVVRVPPRPEPGLPFNGDVLRALQPGGRSTSRGSGDDAYPPLAGTEQLRAWTVVHLHGALTNGHDDGWAHNVGGVGDAARTRYPNEQSARTMWYHDHAMAVTRFNVYAGLAGFWLIRDDQEDRLGLPDGDREIPLILADRNLETESAADGAPRPTGRFLYKQAGFTSATQTPGEVPVTGPYMFVNGRIWPYAEVDAAWHRLRLLNASNSRVLTLGLHDTAADPEVFQEGRQVPWNDAPGEPVDPAKAARRALSRLSGRLVVIGAEGGRLQRPYRPAEDTVRLGPGERLDVLVDLRGLGGHRLELRNEAGTALHALPGNADASVLQLIVDRRRIRDDWEPPAVLEPRFRRYEHLSDGRLRIGDEFVEHHGHAWIGLIPPGTRGGVHPEMWELAEIPHGQPLPETELIQVAGADGTVTSLRPVAKLFDDTTTIRLSRGDWAVWHFLHLGGPAHPMHIHMTDFQMVARRRLTNTAWDLERARTTTPLTHEPVTGPGFDELVRAPKETWTVDPGQWISVLGHFEGASGSFMYHCHILDHEDHTMMRPFTVLPSDIMAFHGAHGGGHEH